MSATLESKTFAKYFEETARLPGEMQKLRVPAPIVNIDAEAYEVVEYFLDSIAAIKGIGSVRGKRKLCNV